MSSVSNPSESALIEGVARVVAIDGGVARLEPEQQGGCGGCASASICNDKGIGTLASRLEARRFALPNHLSLAVGDRVVLGVEAQSLVLASAVAYLIPLVVSLLFAVFGEWRFGSDGLTLLCALAGLVPGFLIMKWVAAAREGDARSGYRIVRRADTIEQCR